MFYQLISRRVGRTAWIGRGVGLKSVGFPGYVSLALKHLADVPEVAQSSTSEFRFAEAVEMEASLFLDEEHADSISEGLSGLDSVDVNTALLELVQPSRVQAHQNAEASALQDMEPISAANFAAEIRLLKRLHKQPDFDAIWSAGERPPPMSQTSLKTATSTSLSTDRARPNWFQSLLASTQTTLMS